MSHEVFISYSTKNSKIANMVCHVLEQNNIKCWIAPRNITSGKVYIDEIIDAVKSTKIVVLVLSEYAQESRYVNNEISLAASYEKPILSFNIDATIPRGDVEYHLMDSNMINAFPVPEDHLETLIIESLNLIKETKPPNPEEYIREKINETTPTENVKNFKYLDDLIHSGVKEIVLNTDIVLNDEEESEYLEGIKLDVDNLVINGNGFSVYAKGKTRIFYCSGKNVTIKNISLKHGFAEDGGGAIYNVEGELSITGSTFIENFTYDYGGAIYTDGKMNIMKSSFSRNIGDGDGGAIRNEGDMRIKDVCFEDNMSSSAEDIYNNGRLVIDENFSSNQTESITNNSISIVSEDFKEKIDNSGKIIKLKTFDVNQKDFTYLNNLINRGIDEIKLENDILLNIENNEDELFKNGIKIDRDDIVIDGNGHTIDAQCFTRIFECSGKNITLKNIILKHGYSLDAGAIYNEGILSLTDSILSDNVAENDAGGIANVDGKLSVAKTIFCKNTANQNGGAVYNLRGDMKINNCEFHENTAKENGAAVYNFSKLLITESQFNKSSGDFEVIDNSPGSILAVIDCNFKFNKTYACINNESDDVKIINCSFSNNNNSHYLILNKNNMNILDCSFESNEELICVIFSEKGSRLFVSGGNIIDNHVKKSAIHTKADECSIGKTVFKNNTILSSDNQYGVDIFNENRLSLQSPKIIRDNGIINKGHVDVRKISHIETERIIRNVDDGSVDEFNIPTEYTFDFSHLNNIIENSDREVITLKEDISLENYELDFFEGGIELDEDNLIIDGNNHIIDGKHKTRIFNVIGKNITLKNIIFKNGLIMNAYGNHVDGGGAIKTVKNSDLILENCEFIDNTSNDDGGAILNNGTLKSRNNRFINNSSKYNGGAIHNNNIAYTTRDAFENNSSKMAGAIYNNNELTIKENIELINNHSDLKEDIYNAKSLKTEDVGLNLEKIVYNTHNINIDKNATEWQTLKYLKMKLTDSDIILDKNIKIEFADIDNDLIMMDNVEFDGNGNIMDLNKMNINFKIKNNVIIKNLTIKNALITKHALFEIEGDIQFENVRFLNNKITTNNYLFNNNGALKFIDSNFSNNTSKNNSLIYNNHSLEIINTNFINNHVNSDGTIVYNIKGNERIVLIKNSLFKYNSTNQSGGTIFNNDHSIIEIFNSEFINNAANIYGGAIFNRGTLSLRKTLFNLNTAKREGGAINSQINAIIDAFNVEFNKNNAESGGAIINIGKLSLTESKFMDNSADYAGAIGNGGKLSLTGSKFMKNSAKNGGAIYNVENSIIEASNVEFNKNTAENGGAVYADSKNDLNLKDCKFKDNMPDDVY